MSERFDQKNIDRQELDQKLKIGSFIFVVLIAVGAIFFMLQEIFKPEFVALEPGEISSLAVLPFTDLSEKQDQAYFGEGLADELVSSLAQLEELNVPGSASSFSENLRDRSVKEIADMLGVEAILEGSVRKSGDKLRVTVQFVRAADDRRIWSQTFDRESGDIFAIQEEIAQEILYKIRYPDFPINRIVDTGTENTDAYNLYLQGRFQWNKRSKEGFERAIEYFEESLQFEPNYARAYAGLADAYVLSVEYGHISQEEGLSRGEKYANTALEIDSNNAEAFATLGLIEMLYHNNSVKAIDLLKKSIELDQFYPTAHHWLHTILNETGRFDEATLHIERAHQLDPLSPIILLNFAIDLHFQKRFDESTQAIKTIFELNPDFPHVYAWQAILHWARGKWDEAEEDLLRGLERLPYNAWITRTYGQHSLFLGEYDVAESLFLRSIELAPHDPLSRLWMGIFYLLRGKAVEATSQFNESLLLDSNNLLARQWIIWSHFLAGEFEDGIEAVEEASGLFNHANKQNLIVFNALKGMLYAKAGDSKSARNILQNLEGSELFLDRISPFQIAIIYAALADSDNMFIWLDLAIEEHSFFGIEFLNVHPVFNPFRNDPRFQELLRKMGFLK